MPQTGSIGAGPACPVPRRDPDVAAAPTPLTIGPVPAGTSREIRDRYGYLGKPYLSQFFCPDFGSVDAEQLDFEDQRGVRRDLAAGARGAIAEIGRNRQPVFRADAHQLQAFRPARDDTVERERRRLAAVVRAVENGAIGER